MWRFANSSIGVSVTFAGAYHLIKCQNSVCASTDDIKKELLAVYFKDESRKTIDELIKKRGKGDLRSSYVCVGNSVSEETSFVFKPLFGERAAFRLKGLIETQDGDIVGVGRVSTMVGEIKQQDFEVSMPMLSSSSKNNMQTLLDLPTRVGKMTGTEGKHFWKGRVPPGSVEGRSYPSVGISYFDLSPDRQVIVDGYICSDQYVDEAGNCTFDRSTEIVPVSTENKPDAEVRGSAHSAEGAIKNESKPLKNDDECPVCRYMKGGPCKDKFLSWDECVTGVKDEESLTNCFQATADMMKCMKASEYYDIMTAGMDFSKVNASVSDSP